jgi:hypothetical protein
MYVHDKLSMKVRLVFIDANYTPGVHTVNLLLTYRASGIVIPLSVLIDICYYAFITMHLSVYSCIAPLYSPSFLVIH